MDALKNVIYLRTAGSYPYNGRINDVQDEVSLEEEECLIDKARKVLNSMEELWETDHSAVKLREEFHLLRHYLSRLPKRPCEENPKQ
jgi:hypothetical protein